MQQQEPLNPDAERRQAGRGRGAQAAGRLGRAPADRRWRTARLGTTQIADSKFRSNLQPPMKATPPERSRCLNRNVMPRWLDGVLGGPGLGCARAHLDPLVGSPMRPGAAQIADSKFHSNRQPPMKAKPPERSRCLNRNVMPRWPNGVLGGPGLGCARAHLDPLVGPPMGGSDGLVEGSGSVGAFFSSLVEIEVLIDVIYKKLELLNNFSLKINKNRALS
jgi:hypothetical protein